MQKTQESFGFQIACRRCDRVIAVCRECWRGQAYCSSSCSAEGRRLSLLAAGARRRQAEDARVRARLRQQRCRARRRALRGQKMPVVTHQSTKKLPDPVSASPRPRRLVACSFCGCHIRYLCSLEQGRSLRRIMEQITRDDIHRDMGRNSTAVLRRSSKHQRHRRYTSDPS